MKIKLNKRCRFHVLGHVHVDATAQKVRKHLRKVRQKRLVLVVAFTLGRRVINRLVLAVVLEITMCCVPFIKTPPALTLA